MKDRKGEVREVRAMAKNGGSLHVLFISAFFHVRFFEEAETRRNEGEGERRGKAVFLISSFIPVFPRLLFVHSLQT